MPTHLLAEWNNREDSNQQWSSNLFYFGDKWDRKQREEQQTQKKKNQPAHGEVIISRFCNAAHSASENTSATLDHRITEW